MTTGPNSQGDRIKRLFQGAEDYISIIAPYIKVAALRSLLEAAPSSVHVRCVTRWLPREVADGVSDPEILDILEERGNFTLRLVDNLHAKIYIAGHNCLVGSSNVTKAALGDEVEVPNIEVLVATTVDDLGVALTLAEIAESERPASRLLADAVKNLSNLLPRSDLLMQTADMRWFPRSGRPDRAYSLYSSPSEGYIVSADQIILRDLAASNVPPGLGENEFQQQICILLRAIPLAKALLDATADTVLTQADALPHLSIFTDRYITANDLWRAFVEWMTHFFPDEVMRQEISQFALRRARLVR